MFRGCCGGKRSAHKSDSDGDIVASNTKDKDAKTVDEPSNLSQDDERLKKLTASVNDVRNNDNNTVLVLFQEDVRALEAATAANGDGVKLAPRITPTRSQLVIKENAIKLPLSPIAKHSSGKLHALQANSSTNSPDDDVLSNSNENLRSCMSRRTSSIASIKKRVGYNDNAVVIDEMNQATVTLKLIEDLADWHATVEDDEVFSDSIEPQLPRGDMCTPYPKRRSSIPGLMYLPDWFGDDSEAGGGAMEPPVTPIGRDELALKRHRFFSDLLAAAQAAVDHRVRFNPFGPDVALTTEDQPADCDPDRPSSTVQLNNLVNRLERIVDRLERTVSARELEAVNATLNAVIQETFAEELESPPPAPAVTQSSPVQPQSPQSPQAAATTTTDDAPPLRPLLYNGDSVDLDSLPTVINEPLPSVSTVDTSLDYLQLEEPDFLPPTSMSVLGYQDIISGPLAQYLDLSKKIGGDVAHHAAAVEQAFAAQLQYVTLASTSAKPDDARQQQLLQPTSQQITAITEFREKNRVSPFFNHLSAISESIAALGWVCVSPTPGPHVKEMNDAGQFYTNRVLKDWKDKDATHVEWARAWIQTLSELQKYIRQHHTTGLVWSGKSAAAGGAPPPPPPGGMPPPPPVLPPVGDLSLGGDDRSALFSQINQGQDITKSLKRVTADMQTHKNAALRSGPAPFKAPVTSSVKAPVGKATPVDKPPVFQQDGKKWIIEYQKNNPSLVVENAEMNNVVYLFKCENSTLTVKGKINGIIADSCKKCSILFDNLVSSIEFVNCQSMQMQVLGSVPTVSIDKTDGCQMYLSEQSLGVEIISSKSSEMNVLIPSAGGDFVEKPIPEQFRTRLNGQSLTTECVESLG